MAGSCRPADAQGVVIAVAGCLDGVAAGVSVKERDDLDYLSAVPPDGLGAPEQRVSATARVVNDGYFASIDAAAGDLLLQAGTLAVVADVATQQLAVGGLQDGAHDDDARCGGAGDHFGFGQQDVVQDAAGDFDAGVVQQQLTAVNVPGGRCRQR